MKYLPLVWAGLWRKPVRSLLTLLSIVIAFTLVGVVSGLNASFVQVAAMARADRIQVYPRFNGPLPVAYLDQIATVAGIAHLAPYSGLGGYYQDPKNGFGMQLVDERFANVWPEANVTVELYRKLAKTRDGIIMNRSSAARFNWKVGDRIPIQTTIPDKSGSKVWTFEVVAIVPDDDQLPNAALNFANYPYLDEGRADGQNGTYSGFELLVSDPTHATQVGDAIEKLFANSSVPVDAYSDQANFQNGLRGYIDMNFFAHAISGAVLFTILFLTGNVMAQSVRERIPEFAAMKAVGFSDGGIFALVMVEAMIPYLIGAPLGLALSEAAPFAARAMIANLNAPMPILTEAVLLFAAVLAFLAALAGGLPAAWRMKRLSVVDALASQ